MGESTGRITFINSHDYVSDVTGTAAVGCLASLTCDDGNVVDLYTQSARLQHTLEMAYSTQRRVTVDFADGQVTPNEQRKPATSSTSNGPSRRLEGPYRLEALWTLE